MPNGLKKNNGEGRPRGLSGPRKTMRRQRDVRVGRHASADTGSERRSRGFAGRRADSNSAKAPREHRQNFIARFVNQWFDRVVGAMKGDGLSSAEERYAPHRTTRDFVCNTLGSGAWALVFPVVTMVSTQLVGVEQAGMISMAFVVGLLLMFVGNFGVRTYQISDINREHSFIDYQANRWATCVLMLIVGWIYCSIRGYDSEMFDISMAVIIYRCVDALADVYEGRLQQVDKLYLAGISQTIRSLLAVLVFSVILFFSRSAVAACTGMAIAAAATFVVVTWPLTLLETPKTRSFSFPSFIDLFKVCAPLFVALFFFNVIENMPKFVMEDSLPYDNQLYYNALYFPAQMILITAQLIYKPLLLRMAGVWQDSAKRRKFNLILAGIIALIAAITLVFALIMAWVGIPVMNWLYGIDFNEYCGLLYLMLVTGGITAAIDFLFQIITIMRRQKDVTVLFCMTFIFSIFIPILLVRYAQLEGAVLSYVIVEGILFVLLAWEYFRIRRDLHGKTLTDADVASGGASAGSRAGRGSVEPQGTHSERTSFVDLIDLGDPEISEAQNANGGIAPEEEPQKLRPSEIRAIREHREEVMRKRTGHK